MQLQYIDLTLIAALLFWWAHVDVAGAFHVYG